MLGILISFILTFPLAPIFSTNIKEFFQSLLIAIGGPLLALIATIRNQIVLGTTSFGTDGNKNLIETALGESYINDLDNAKTFWEVGLATQNLMRAIIFGTKREE